MFNDNFVRVRKYIEILWKIHGFTAVMLVLWVVCDTIKIVATRNLVKYSIDYRAFNDFQYVYSTNAEPKWLCENYWIEFFFLDEK